MSFVTALPFPEARRVALEQVLAVRKPLPIETVALEEASGRVLAADQLADRDYPPRARSVRDGFAVRSADLPGVLTIIGEARAGADFHGSLEAHQAVEIMTGALLPDGADQVVMIEHVTVTGDRVDIPLPGKPGDAFNRRASESSRGDSVVAAGTRIGYVETAMLAAIGAIEVPVYRRPRVAILATGDEIVAVRETPSDSQIRNSNAHSLAEQVRRAGGHPEVLPVASDVEAEARELIERGLRSDLLLISGGVSAGKYDVVERALAALDAEFFFDRVLIQPGQPLVFGLAQGKPFFGLPGNPASTMICFEVFGRAALELIAGQRETILPLTEAVLTEEFRQKPGVTRFLPARLHSDGVRLTPIPWTGSSDIAAMARANVFLVTDPAKTEYKAGEHIRILLR
jgi:molybdopterin molybdotransferase